MTQILEGEKLLLPPKLFMNADVAIPHFCPVVSGNVKCSYSVFQQILSDLSTLLSEENLKCIMVIHYYSYSIPAEDLRSVEYSSFAVKGYVFLVLQRKNIAVLFSSWPNPNAVLIQVKWEVHFHLRCCPAFSTGSP